MQKSPVSQGKVYLVVRLILGLMMVVFGSNKFFGFLSMPPPGPAEGAFLGALAATGYMFPWIALVEIGAGITFLANRFATLGALLLAPVTLNIIAFHLFLSPPSGWPMGIAVVIGNFIILWGNRARFREVLKP